MVVETLKSEQSCDTGRMEDFDSVRRHLVSDEIKRQVDVCKEELHRKQSIEELSWRIIFDNFHPNLLLLAVGALDKVIRVAEIHVLRPHAAEFVAILAGVILKVSLSFE